jgi:hypothetical protein
MGWIIALAALAVLEAAALAYAVRLALRWRALFLAAQAALDELLGLAQKIGKFVEEDRQKDE